MREAETAILSQYSRISHTCTLIIIFNIYIDTEQLDYAPDWQEWEGKTHVHARKKLHYNHTFVSLIRLFGLLPYMMSYRK